MVINGICLLTTVTIILSLGVGTSRGQGKVSITTKSTVASALKPNVEIRYQTDGFNSSNVRSGPIVIVDKKTIFISIFHYNGNYSSAHFWTGTGNPSPNGRLVPDENNSTDTLNAYHGRNIYLKLPGYLTTDNIDYIGVWSKEWRDLGYVRLFAGADNSIRSQIPEALGFDQRTVDNKLIFRVPKCCGPYEYFSENNKTCIKSKEEIKVEYQVYESNQTHINNDTFMKNVEFVPYTKILICPPNYSRFILDEFFIFGFLYNATIIYYDKWLARHGVFTQDDFCMDKFEEINDTAFLICHREESKEASIMPSIYLPLLFISLACFVLSASCFVFILKVEDLQQKCFVGYSTSMAFTFLFLICLQMVNSSCILLGSLFIFSILCSFIWLTCLCLDLIRMVSSFEVDESEEEESKKKKYFYYYLFASILIPSIVLLISLVSDGIPGVPKSFMKQYFQHHMCSFEGGHKNIFFVPIGILISISFVALCYTLYIIAKFEKSEKNKFDWLKNRNSYKFRLISLFITWITLCVWFIEIVAMGKALQFSIDVIEASSGIFAVFIFVLNKYTRKQIGKALNRNNRNERRHISFGEFLNLDQRADDNNENQTPP